MWQLIRCGRGWHVTVERENGAVYSGACPYKKNIIVN